MKTKQLQFSEIAPRPKQYFGGTLLVGRRRSFRPLSTKHALHLVMRSTRAKGPHSFKRHKPKIQMYLKREASKFGVRVYKSSYPGNHIHLLLRIHSRNEYRKFIRAISSLIAGAVTNTLGRRVKEKFWDARPFSRIVRFGKDYQIVARYLVQNTLEAYGLIPYSPRKNKYSSG